MLFRSSLKIDRGFVQKLQRGSSEAAVLRAIVSLGASLGRSIIAEGIESAEQMEQLRLLGCRAGQGYHLARPLAAERIGKMLAASISSARLRQAREPVFSETRIH